MSDPKFKFDELLEKEDICNLTREAEALRAGMLNGKKMVIYGRRNMGKTSLVKNVLAKDFAKKYPDTFIMMADLMEVKTFDSIQNRIQIAFSEAFSNSFPTKNLLKGVHKFLTGLKPVVEIDPVSGTSTFSVAPSHPTGVVPISELFKIIREKISKEKKVLIIMDEFQDVSLVPEAAGRLRAELQKLKDIPIFILGSKKHLLARMFAVPDAPFADFGSDLEFQSIPYREYHEYILARLRPAKLTMSYETSCYLQDQLQRLPEPINIVGAYLVDHFERQEITPEIIQQSIIAVIATRRERFEALLAALSDTEEKIVISLAKHSPVPEPTGKQFLSTINISHGTVRNTVSKLENRGYIERSPAGWIIANPLLHCFLLRFR